MRLSAITAVLLLAAVCSAAAQNPSTADFRVYERRYDPGMRVTPYLRYQLDMAWRQDKARVARLESVGSAADVLQLQNELREKLLAVLGGLPAEKTPLNAKVTGTVRASGYRVEKVIFESLPGFHVTANIYIPDGLAALAPAVLLTCGHSFNGKGHPGYQQICGRLARRGYVVLTWDPVGQGERSQCWDASKGDSRYNRVCGEHAIMGNLAYLAGTNLARWEVWDGIRAHDYLLTRPEVDPARISVTGNSGGGFQSAFLGALDQRNRVVIPSCYISSLPMRMANRIYADPDDDPEQDLYGMVSRGIDHAGLLALVWPRPLAVNLALLDFFPIEGGRMAFRQAEPLWRLYGRAQDILLNEGYHPHGYSLKNQENSFAFLDIHNGLPPRWSLDSVQALPERDLWCTESGQVRLEYPDGVSFFESLRQYWRQRREENKTSLMSLYQGAWNPGISKWSVRKDDGGRPEQAILWEKCGSARLGDRLVDKYILTHSGGLQIPVLHFHAEKPGAVTMLWFSLDGKVKNTEWQALSRGLDKGTDILSFDFRALGENRLDYQVTSVDDPRLAGVPLEQQYFSPLSGVLINYVANSLLSGRPYFLQMIEDVEIVSKFAREALGVKNLQIRGAGKADRLASSAAEVLPGLEYSRSPDAAPLAWPQLVESGAEDWPVHYILPLGAYVE